MCYFYFILFFQKTSSWNRNVKLRETQYLNLVKI